MFRSIGALLCGAALAAAGGCQTLTTRAQTPEPNGAPSARDVNVPFRPSVPTEMDKTTLPPYVIEPPDELLLDAIKLVPKVPYKLQAQDTVQIVVIGALPEQPIGGQYVIDSDGTVDLGPTYGKVKISGFTTDDARERVLEHLRQIVRDPEVSLTLSQAAGQQEISGDHLVSPDGTIHLGVYGRVHVSGLTVAEAKAAIEKHLSEYLEEPKVAVDIYSYQSKVYYIITEGAGSGDKLMRVPITGNETVLDALSYVNGLSATSSKNIWIARPGPGGLKCDQVLPVSWDEIAKGAATTTNYQLLPGDRVFIAEDKMLALDNVVKKLTGPFERAFGFTLLGGQTIQTMNRFPLGFQSGSGF